MIQLDLAIDEVERQDSWALFPALQKKWSSLQVVAIVVGLFCSQSESGHSMSLFSVQTVRASGQIIEKVKGRSNPTTNTLKEHEVSARIA